MAWLLVFIFVAALAATLMFVTWSYDQDNSETLEVEEIPEGAITRGMKDPFSQVLWKTFDSGGMVTHNAGDKHMTVTKDGKTEKVLLEE